MEKIAIIGTVGVPGKYGGFETLAHQLVNQLSAQFKLFVYCSTKAYAKSERKKYLKGARLFYLPFNANGFQSIIYDIVSMIHALFYADTFIILGVSGGLFIPILRIFTKKKIIVNIDGLEWRRAKWGRFTKAFLHYSEKVAVKWSHADITDNAMIKRYTSMKYKTISHLIAYGADHVINKKGKTYGQYRLMNEEYAFKVARIEPENNIHLVLEAFSKIDYTLIIVGNWDNSTYGKELKARYATYKNIFILDPIYDQDQLDLLRSNAAIYIHGHSAGGTNPSLVEAMGLSLPIICYNVSYNRATTENQCFYFSTAQELCEIVNTTSFESLTQCSISMKRIAERRYTWQVIARQYAQLVYQVKEQTKKIPLTPRMSKIKPKDLLTGELGHMTSTMPYYEERF